MTYISRWNNYQTPVSSWISTFQDKEERVKEVQGCTLDVGDFKNTLTFRFKGR